MPFCYDPHMPTRNISLTGPLDAFIDGSVASGRYQNASEVVRASLRLLERDQREDAARLERLLTALDVADAEIDQGLGIEISRAELPDYLARLGRTGRRDS